MQSYEERQRRQEALQAIRHDVERELRRIPGVVSVGIGFKETAQKRTDDIVLRVYVEAKKAFHEIAPEHRIPGQIYGFPTDVCTPYRLLQTGSSTVDLAELQKRQRGLLGGIQITSSKKTLKEYVTEWYLGTLGCIARLQSDDSIVLLSNHHVMFAKGAVIGDGISQPVYLNFFCCKCNIVAEIIDGIFDDTIDAAIARLDPNVAAENTIFGIEGPIAGSDTAVVGDIVIKVGRDTGLTMGKVTDIAGSTQEVNGHQMLNQIVIEAADEDGNSTNGTFADTGDSGSVIVRKSDNKVVGLLHGREPGNRSIGYACHIGDVENRLNIRIIEGNFTTGGGTQARLAPESGSARSTQKAAEDPLGLLQNKLDQSPAGRTIQDVIDQHLQEIAFLVNQRRPVTVVWQRKKGPSYLAALLRQAKEPAYRIPDEIDGVSRQNFLMSLLSTLEDHGSTKLKAALRQYGLLLIAAAAKSETIDEVLRAIEADTRPG